MGEGGNKGGREQGREGVRERVREGVKERVRERQGREGEEGKTDLIHMYMAYMYHYFLHMCPVNQSVLTFLGTCSQRVLIYIFKDFYLKSPNYLF